MVRNRNFVFRHIYAIVYLMCDFKPVVSSGGNCSTLRKPPLNLKSLATFSHAQAGIRTQVVVRESVQNLRPHGHQSRPWYEQVKVQTVCVCQSGILSEIRALIFAAGNHKSYLILTVRLNSPPVSPHLGPTAIAIEDSTDPYQM